MLISLLKNGWYRRLRNTVVFFPNYVGQLPESGRSDGAVDVVVLVEPGADNSSSRADASDLDALAAPSRLTSARVSQSPSTTVTVPTVN